VAGKLPDGFPQHPERTEKMKCRFDHGLAVKGKTSAQAAAAVIFPGNTGNSPFRVASLFTLINGPIVTKNGSIVNRGLAEDPRPPPAY